MRKTNVQGTIAEGFERVREEFTAVVAEEQADPGAQLAVYVNGRLVVDLWAGSQVTGESLTGVLSSGKGATYLVVALLVQEGVLTLDQAVAYSWPEFGAEGKANVTLRDLLTHCAGVIGADGGFTTEELADDRLIVRRLAGQRPYWKPGSAYGYHALVIGALIGEVVRRVTSRSLQEVYEERIRAPYGFRPLSRLPETLEARYVEMQPWLPTPQQRAALEANGPDPHGLPGIAINLNAITPFDMVQFINTRAVRALGQSSVGAVGNARGLVKLYAAAISEVDGQPPLLGRETLAEFSRLHSRGIDLVSGIKDHFALGFEAKHEPYPFLGEDAFGHSGWAGSEAFADPKSGPAYGYTRRRFPAFFAAPETARLAAAARRAAEALR